MSMQAARDSRGGISRCRDLAWVGETTERELAAPKEEEVLSRC
jgi:hypothetical protein